MLITTASKFKTDALEAAKNLAAQQTSGTAASFQQAVFEAIQAQLQAVITTAIGLATVELLGATFRTNNSLRVNTALSADLHSALNAYRCANPASTHAGPLNALTGEEFIALQALLRTLAARLSGGGVSVEANWSFGSTSQLPTLSLRVSVSAEHPTLAHLEALRPALSTPTDPPSGEALALSKQLTDGFNSSLDRALEALRLELANAASPQEVLADKSGRLGIAVKVPVFPPSSGHERFLTDVASAIAHARGVITQAGYRCPTVALQNHGHYFAVTFETIAPVPQTLAP